jgi:hypothetical protein
MYSTQLSAQLSLRRRFIFSTRVVRCAVVGVAFFLTREWRASEVKEASFSLSLFIYENRW